VSVTASGVTVSGPLAKPACRAMSFCLIGTVGSVTPITKRVGLPKTICPDCILLLHQKG
jgi:hypothetical protein